MRCVSYTRTVPCIPGSGIPKDAIGQQNARIQEFVRSRGWKISGKYSDRKKDAGEEAAFLRMKADGMERKFDCVVVDSVFCCGRNYHAAAELLYKIFYPAGIRFAVAEDGFYSGERDSGEVQAYFNRKEVEYRRELMLPGKLEHIQNRVYGKYGYRISPDTGELEADPVSSETVRLIFRLAAGGTNPGKIAQALTAGRIQIPSVYQGHEKKGMPEADRTRWSPSIIKAILKNRAYMGDYERLVDGEKVQVGCPAIVERELFEKAQRIFRTRRQGAGKLSGQQVLNPFAERITDRDTGHRIASSVLVSSGERIFRLRYPEPADISYEKRYIRCSEVMEAVTDALKAEKKKASCAREMLRAGRGNAARQERCCPCLERLREIFYQMAEIESRNVPAYLRWQAGEISEDMYREQYGENVREIEKLEILFREQMEKLDGIDLAFSEKNPWIRLYADIEIPEELTRAQARKWLERVEVARFEAVEPVMKELGAYSMLPQEWFVVSTKRVTEMEEM